MLNSDALNDGQLEICLQKRDEQVEITTNAKFLHTCFKHWGDEEILESYFWEFT